MAYLERSRGKKYYGSMELMKTPLSKSAQTTGQTSIPTGGFTIGQATSANTLRGWQTGERNAEVKTVADLLDEIENETLYRALLTVDRRTLQIILLKMQGYSTKEIAPFVGLTTGAIYARLDHLRKSCGRFYNHLIFSIFLWTIG